MGSILPKQSLEHPLETGMTFLPSRCPNLDCKIILNLLLHLTAYLGAHCCLRRSDWMHFTPERCRATPQYSQGRDLNPVPAERCKRGCWAVAGAALGTSDHQHCPRSGSRLERSRLGGGSSASPAQRAAPFPLTRPVPVSRGGE